MFRNAWTWIAFTGVCLAGMFFAFMNFPKAFPIVNLDLSMDRSHALARAAEVARKHGWGPEMFRQAASFGVDSYVQAYVELEAGGAVAFTDMLAHDLFAPYTWSVRNYQEGSIREVALAFTPSGEFYGVNETIPEDEPGAALDAEDARMIAESAAAEWPVELNAYVRVETTREVRPGGRIDHAFVYERPDLMIGEGRYRLRLGVSGDRLTELTHFIKIPEGFGRRYSEMRAANHTLSTVAYVVIGILYAAGGCLGGLFILLRQRWVLWRQPLKWGVFVAGVTVLVQINFLPLYWMYYDTALSSTGFLLQQAVQLLFTLLYETVLLTVSFMAAESLTRKAFGSHVRFWQIWSPDVAGSRAVLGRTLGGYLAVGIDLALVVATYMLATRAFGWWSPSDTLFQPDMLATYFPWLTSIGISLHAGFWEECLFRAVPLAGAALLGNRFGRRRLWIAGALILQALVFGAAHANYAQQPSYARLLELILPSLFFGYIYLRYGLLAGIILHFTIDVVFISAPLFTTTAPGAGSDRALVIILGLVPLWVVLYRLWRRKGWAAISDDHLNRGWQPAPAAVGAEHNAPAVPLALTGKRLVLLGLLGLAGLAAWLMSAAFNGEAPRITVTRKAAITAAREELARRGVNLDESWMAVADTTEPNDQDDRFIWQEGDPEIYRGLMGTYLNGPGWKVRFLRFEGPDIEERAEEYNVFLNGSGNSARFRHVLPESRPGPAIEAEQARVLALETAHREWGLAPDALEEIAAVPLQLPARRDWTFTFRDRGALSLEQGQARGSVTICGDEPADAYRFVFVPEEWQRQERSRQNIAGIIGSLCRVLFIAGVLAGTGYAVVAWSRKRFVPRRFIAVGSLLFGLAVISFFNNWPAMIAWFSTARPFGGQVFMQLGSVLVSALFLALGMALLTGVNRSASPELVSGSCAREVTAGLCIGLFSAGLISAARSLPAAEGPVWGSLHSSGYCLPWLEGMSAGLSGFIGNTAVALIALAGLEGLTRGGSRRKGAAIALCLAGGFILAGFSLSNLTEWFIAGLVTGPVLTAAYLLALRGHRPAVPAVLVVHAVLAGIQQAIMHPFPGAAAGAVLGVFAVMAAAVLWIRNLTPGTGEALPEPADTGRAADLDPL